MPPTLLLRDRHPTHFFPTECHISCIFPTELFARGRESLKLWFDCPQPARAPTQYILSRTVPAPSPARSADVLLASVLSALRYKTRTILVAPRPYMDRTGIHTDRTAGSLRDLAPAPLHARPYSPIPARSPEMNSARRVRAPQEKTLSMLYSSFRRSSLARARR